MSHVKPVHPILFALFSVIFLYVHNINQASLEDLPLPVSIILISTAFIWLILYLILRESRKAAIILTVALALFFTYGHLYDALRYQLFDGMKWCRHRTMLPVWMLIFTTISFYTWKTRRNLDTITRFLNVTTLILIVFSVTSFVTSAINRRNILSSDNDINLVNSQLSPVGYLPDIYYIIPDGYANNHILESIYNTSDREFLDFLSERNFYVATESRANYAHTFLSLSSTISMDYLDYLSEKLGTESLDPAIPYSIIRNGKAVKILKKAGYRFVLIRSGWGPTNYNKHADIAIKCGELNEYMEVLIHSTMLILLEGRIWFPDQTRVMALNQFSELENSTALPSPKFVLTHFLVPHPPFVFDAEGKPVNPENLTPGTSLWNPKSNYIGQLKFVNTKLREVIQEILDNSERDPIIIIQSDHGPASLENWLNPSREFITERLMIFSAIHFPGSDTTHFHKDMTPINVFRILFNTYLGTDFEILADSSYYSPLEFPYKFTECSNTINTTLEEYLQDDSLSVTDGEQ